MNSASSNLQNKIMELSRITYSAITTGICRACGTCIKFCPLNIREFNSERKAITINSNRSCGGCSVCFSRCPQNAISLIPVQRSK